MTQENPPSKNMLRPKVNWWQRNYLVNRELQVKFAASGALVGLFSSVVSAGLLLWSFWAFNIWQGQRLPGPVLAVIGFVLILNVSAIYITAIFATHRIVGPIFNLLRQFQRVGKGDFSAQARFRDYDEMHYLARRFNEMVDKLNERNRTIESDVENLKQALEKSDAASGLATANRLLAFFESERKSAKAPSS